MFMSQNQGWIEVISGGMFSGKSEELLRRVKRVEIAKIPFQVFKPAVDDRYDDQKVVSHSGVSCESVAVSSSKRIGETLLAKTQVVAIDEIQFFDEGVVDLVSELANEGKRIILAGLDKDFRGNPFPGPMSALLALADEVTKVHAICIGCGNLASFSHRLGQANLGSPSSDSNNQTVLIGGGESYEPKCRCCFPHDGAA